MTQEVFSNYMLMIIIILPVMILNINYLTQFILLEFNSNDVDEYTVV